MSASISAFFVGGQPVQLVQDVGEAVVDVGADLLERVGVLVEGVLVVDRDAVAEHDRIGDLHHGRLEVEGQQDAVLLGRLDLLGVERAQRGDVHDRGVDDLAGLESQPFLQDGGRAVVADELDFHLGGAGPWWSSVSLP